MRNLPNFDNKYVYVLIFYYCAIGTKSSKSKTFWSNLNGMNHQYFEATDFLLQSKWYFFTKFQILANFFLEVIEC